MIHGRKDWTISFAHGETLYAAVSGDKYSFWVDEAGHDNLYRIAGSSYLRAIQNFASTLDLPPR